jgi:chromate reductase
VKVLAISGSLRAGSSNAALLRVAAEVAPPGMTIDVWEGLGGLPHFNPDLDEGEPPAPVRDFRRLLASADAVIISSPEYAHGMPGSLKNAIDWLVSDGTLVGKPVLIITTAPTRGEFAHAQLVEVLTTMQWNVLTGASLLLRKNDEFKQKLSASLRALSSRA